MQAKPLIILATIIFFGLVHAELKAKDSISAGSGLATAATDLKENAEKKSSLIGRRNGFSRETRKWQTYASAAAGDHGKGERYLHISDAGIEGGGGFDGFMFYAGAMFPF